MVEKLTMFLRECRLWLEVEPSERDTVHLYLEVFEIFCQLCCLLIPREKETSVGPEDCQRV